MNISRIDLNLLVYLDTLLRMRNVTQAANHLGITQPAMSNGLKRLRDLFEDPLLVRTSEGMMPTERALKLQPVIRNVLANVEKALQPTHEFDAENSTRVFRIMASDYAESTLIQPLLQRLSQVAPKIRLDIMTPSDVSYQDVEQGTVDIIINRFDDIPMSFHQVSLWHDGFSCLFSKDNPIAEQFDLRSYLKAQHIWVSKTGMGTGVGVNPSEVQKLGWIDEALMRIGKTRNITVFTRHYLSAVLFAQQPNLILTIPSKAAQSQRNNPKLLIKPAPFAIEPFEVKMAWSPLLQSNPDHQWMRQLIKTVANEIESGVVEM
ncbi:LysR family transcriptional regulator [Vibrio sp. qd031]|jgi:DNA-binding transcriptional LysR family regulator|uniref:LysR family transcriptional regulator n=1 Tax=Vibrio sp. qd031 TaxID=1603038 RepID=UPI000A0F6525|nr:LysR family transcriptional regulator [Vibrio sp. qd031]ORT52214.1 LysR family transcriptional regulator [Vibrio sp. qd031]